MKLGAKMKMLREMHDLTQMQLAEQAGVTQAYIARIESSKVVNPKASGIAGLARTLGVPVEVLLDDHLSVEAWQNETNAMKIDTEGREMLKLFKSLRPKEKKLVVEFTRLLHHQQ